MISLLATLVILGLVFYLVTLIPMAEPFPTVIRVVAIIIAVLIVLQWLGIMPLGFAGISLH